MVWPVGHDIVYCMAWRGMARYMVWPWRGMAWYIVLPGGLGMVYDKVGRGMA